MSSNEEEDSCISNDASWNHWKEQNMMVDEMPASLSGAPAIVRVPVDITALAVGRCVHLQQWHL